MITKRVVAAKFERAGKSIPELRSITESFIKKQKIPKGTEIQPVLVNDIAAEIPNAPNKYPPITEKKREVGLEFEK